MKKMNHSMWLGIAFWLFAIVFTVVNAGSQSTDPNNPSINSPSMNSPTTPPSNPSDSPSSSGQTVSGTVSSVSGDTLTLTNDQGMTTSFRIDKKGSSQAKNLKAGDRVTLGLNESNRIISINKSGGSNPGSMSPGAPPESGPGSRDGMTPGTGG